MSRKAWIWIGILLGIAATLVGVLMVISGPRKLHYGSRSLPEDEL